MHWTVIVLIVVIGYYFSVFVLSRVLLPHYGWKKQPLPRQISSQLQAEIDRLKAKNPSQDMFLRAAYDLIGTRFSATLTVFFHIPTLFIRSPERLWNRKGRYVGCHQLNLLLRIFLVKSGLFKDYDIEVHYAMTEYIMTHQYLKVWVDDELITVDPWGKQYKVGFGHHAQGFISPTSRLNRAKIR